MNHNVTIEEIVVIVNVTVEEAFEAVTVSEDQEASAVNVFISDGEPGAEGKSAYKSWLDAGNTGSEADFVEWMRGTTGKSAYEVWLDLGYEGTEADYHEWNRGQDAINNTLEMVRLENPQINGDIEANGNTISGIRNAVTDQEPATLGQLMSQIQSAKEYADTVASDTVRSAGFWDAIHGTFPTAGFGTGTAGAIRRGDEFEVSNGTLTIGGEEFQTGDLLRARVANPGQDPTKWSSAQGNVQKALETRQGLVKIANASTVENENSTNDEDAITAKKLWSNFLPKLLQKALTWTAQQTFAISPRISTVTASKILRSGPNKEIISTDSISADEIADSATRVLVSPAEKGKIGKFRVVQTFQALQANIAANNTYFLGGSPRIFTTTSARYMKAVATGTITYASGTLQPNNVGSNEDIVIRLRNVTAGQTAVVTLSAKISAQDNPFSSVLNMAVTQGDNLEMQISTPAMSNVGANICPMMNIVIEG